MTRVNLFGLLGLALALAACETVPGPPPPPPPPPAPIAHLVGVAQFHTQQGRTVTCAGLSVALMADTRPTEERMQALYGSTRHAIEPVEVVKARSASLDRAGAQPIASAECDSEGAFDFHAIEPGGYYMIAHMRRTPAGKAPDDLVIMQWVSVGPGETRQVRLAP